MRIQQLPLRHSHRGVRSSVVGVVSVALALTGCAAASTNRVSYTDTMSSSSTLTAADFERVPSATTALEAVRQLRPLFLRPRPGSNALRNQPSVVAVYIDNLYAGNVDVLQTIPPSEIAQMHYLQRSDAMTFAGSATAGDGFIMVTLKKHGGS
jgi:hypothetical protein